MVLLSGAWQLWSSHLHVATARAQFELAVADERQIAKECNAREQGKSDSLASEVLEPTTGALKRLLLEFRQRLVAALADMLLGSS